MAIEKAISSSAENNLNGINIHLNNALSKLSDKKSADYRNSIKESLCQQIVADNNAVLPKAIKILKDDLSIHPALEQGFRELYGWTSDRNGIHHAIIQESHLDQKDALYMLVSCSAFINYLITKANKKRI